MLPIYIIYKLCLENTFFIFKKTWRRFKKGLWVIILCLFPEIGPFSTSLNFLTDSSLMFHPAA
jgi:hypothetical protein